MYMLVMYDAEDTAIFFLADTAGEWSARGALGEKKVPPGESGCLSAACWLPSCPGWSWQSHALSPQAAWHWVWLGWLSVVRDPCALSQGSVGLCGLRVGRARASHEKAEDVGGRGVPAGVSGCLPPAEACHLGLDVPSFLRFWAQHRRISGAVPVGPCTCMETWGPGPPPPCWCRRLWGAGGQLPGEGCGGVGRLPLARPLSPCPGWEGVDLPEEQTAWPQGARLTLQPCTRARSDPLMCSASHPYESSPEMGSGALGMTLTL